MPLRYVWKVKSKYIIAYIVHTYIRFDCEKCKYIEFVFKYKNCRHFYKSALLVRPGVVLIRIACFIYKQKNGKMNNNGNRNGTAINDKPQVQVLPTIAVMIIPNTVADTIKHPPFNRTETCIVGGADEDVVVTVLK